MSIKRVLTLAASAAAVAVLVSPVTSASALESGSQGTRAVDEAARVRTRLMDMGNPSLREGC